MKISLEKKHLDLKVVWRLSRNQTNFKENFILKIESSEGVFLSEIAPNIRYGETPESIETQFASWKAIADMGCFGNTDTLAAELDKQNLHHALRFGLESAALARLAKKNNQSLTEFLHLPPMKAVPTSFSMPIIPIGEIKDYLAPLNRFHSLKIKVNAETGLDMLQEIHKHTQVKLRVDANEGWKDLDEFARLLEKLKGMNIELIEQPFPSSMQAEFKELKKISPYILLADESIEDVGNFHELSQQFHAVNIKLMKTGSLIKARDFLNEAKKFGMQSMIGCMIETTVGISYGMLFGGMVDYVDLDGFLLVKDEPFQLVTESEGILSLN